MKFSKQRTVNRVVLLDVNEITSSPYQPRRATRLFIVKDLRVFMNTISKAVSTMKLAGIDINTTKVEDEEYICYTMRIPKKSAYRTHSA